jgi:hypothetical protein
VRAPEGGVPVWVSRGSLRRAADFPDLPTAIQKILYRGRDSLCRYGNRFKLFAQPCLNFGCVRSRNRGAANRSRSNRVVGSISLGRAKARGVRQSLNDTEALKERAGTVMPGPIPTVWPCKR